MPTVIDKVRDQDDMTLREYAAAEMDGALARIRMAGRTTSLDAQKRDEAVVDTLVMTLADVALTLGIELQGLLDAVKEEYEEALKDAEAESATPAPAPAGTTG